MWKFIDTYMMYVYIQSKRFSKKKKKKERARCSKTKNFLKWKISLFYIFSDVKSTPSTIVTGYHAQKVRRRASSRSLSRFPFERELQFYISPRRWDVPREIPVSGKEIDRPRLEIDGFDKPSPINPRRWAERLIPEIIPLLLAPR